MTGFHKWLSAALHTLGIAVVTITLGVTLAATSALVTAPAAWANNAQYTFETDAQERTGEGKLEEIAQKQRSDDRGHGGDDEQIDRLGERLFEHRPDIAPKDDENGDERAHVQQRIQQDAGVADA